MFKIKSALISVFLLALFCVSVFSLQAASALNPVQVQISCYSTSVWWGVGGEFNATASGGTGSYTYQWYSNGNPIPYATAKEYTYYAPVGTFTVYAIAKDAQNTSLASATSNSITLTVKPIPTGGGGPVMATQPGATSPTPSSSSPVPEFPSWIILPLLVAATVFGAILIISSQVERRRNC